MEKYCNYSYFRYLNIYSTHRVSRNMITIIVVCHFNFVSAFRAPSNLFPQHVAVEFYGKSWSLFFTLHTKFCRSWKNYSFLHSGNQLLADSVVRNPVVGGATVQVHPLEMWMWSTNHNLTHGNEFQCLDIKWTHSPRNSHSAGRMPRSPHCQPGWAPPRPSGHSSRELRTSTPGHCIIALSRLLISIISIYFYVMWLRCFITQPPSWCMSVAPIHQEFCLSPPIADKE